MVNRFDLGYQRQDVSLGLVKLVNFLLIRTSVVYVALRAVVRKRDRLQQLAARVKSIRLSRLYDSPLSLELLFDAVADLVRLRLAWARALRDASVRRVNSVMSVQDRSDFSRMLCFFLDELLNVALNVL